MHIAFGKILQSKTTKQLLQANPGLQGWNPVPSATPVSERNRWVGLDVPTEPGRR